MVIALECNSAGVDIVAKYFDLFHSVVEVTPVVVFSPPTTEMTL